VQDAAQKAVLQEGGKPLRRTQRFASCNKGELQTAKINDE